MAKGTAFVPILNTLFRADLERNYISNVETNLFSHFIILFKRFTDDLLFIYSCQSFIKDFIMWLNEIFLDTKIFKTKEGKLVVKTHKKER